MAVDFFIDDEGVVCVFHDKPFPMPIGWIELNAANGHFDFVREDGTICNFGIPVEPDLLHHMMNVTEVNLIQLDPVTEDVVESQIVSLNIQAA